MQPESQNVTEAEAGADSRRSRRVLPTILVVVASILGLVATLALWVERQALETDTWTETSSRLLEDEDIRSAVADARSTAPRLAPSSARAEATLANIPGLLASSSRTVRR